MLVFFKENSYSIAKMIVNQAGMTIFGTVLAFATSSNRTLFLATSLFSIAFYLTLLYSMAWELGAKDKIRVDGGRMKKKPWLGMQLSLAASSPNILLVLLLFVGYIFGSKSVGIAQEWAGNLYFLANQIIRFWMGMYIGTVNYFLPRVERVLDDQVITTVNIYSILNPVYFLLAIFPAVIVCAVAYYFGLRNIRLSAFFNANSNTGTK